MDILASLTVKLSSYAAEMLETNFTNSPPPHPPNWVGKKLKITTKLYEKHQLHQAALLQMMSAASVTCLSSLSPQIPCHVHCI